MTDPSEPLGLDTIQASASGHPDVPALIAEINRLREELDAANRLTARLNAQLVRIRDLAHHWKALAPTGITALCGNAILAVLDQPDADPQTTTGAHHETPISTHRIGWVTWQAIVTLDECSCDAVQARTADRARARMLQAHTAAVQAGRCPA